MLKRERLSASLAKRPSLDMIKQRNILPDAQQASLARQKLASAMERRPTVDLLHQRNILPSEAEETQQEKLAKRQLLERHVLKRGLESFLEKRPTIEQVQAALPTAASIAGPGSGRMTPSLDERFVDML